MAPGTEIGGYRVLSPLGQGGMGAVYRAVDGAGTPVALKLLHPHLAAEAQARERLRREVAHLQRVRHPAVARVLDAEIDSTEAFVVTELVDGPDLGAYVRTHGPLRGEQLADLAERLREALETVHAAGVLHRDLTPGNVLVTDDGPVLIDFGIAQAVEDARVTSTGMVVGTPGYLSPELLEGGEPSAAADWWGWAAVLAFAATGRPPFGTRPLQAVLARVRAGEADLEGLDPRTTAALRSALVVEPWRRTAPVPVVAALRDVAAGGVAADDQPTSLVASGAPTSFVAAPEPGGTRVLPMAPPPPPPPPPSGENLAPTWEAGPRVDEGHDDGVGYDAGAYDGHAYDGHDDGAPDEGGAWPEELAPEETRPPRRAGTVLAIGALLVALGATRPGVALLAAVAAAVLVRSVGLDVVADRRRRSRRGPRRGDPARAVASWPWYLLRAVLGVLPAALVAVSLVVLAGGVSWWLLGTGRLVVAEPTAAAPAGELTANAAWVTPALLAALTAVGLLALWFGPMQRATRDGARWTLGAVAPGGVGAATVVVLALLATGVVTALVLLGLDGVREAPVTVWWPLPGPPGLR